MSRKKRKRRRREKQRQPEEREQPCTRGPHRFGQFHIPRGHFVFGFQRWWPDAPIRERDN
jgi:hypothetical protein